MSTVQYTLVQNEEGSGIICYVPGYKPMVADDTHPNFDRIIQGALSGDPAVIKLFDVAQTASEKFEALSERVTVKNGSVYLDGDLVNDALTKQIVRFIDEDEDFTPLVNFFENVQANPNEHSRQQLFAWLDNRDFTITDEGMIVAYKGVNPDGNGGYLSVHSGKAIVNGEVKTGRIPNPLDGIIEMPRSEVHHDPSAGCSTGLHVADFNFANSFADTVLEVEVNPRDVVSVPTDDPTFAKVRCCRYKVVGVVQEAYDSALRASYDESGYVEDDYEGWGELEYDDTPASDPVSRGVYRGDVFKDRDARRRGRTLTVENVDTLSGTATCLSSSSGKRIPVNIDRLLSYRYERVN